MKPSLPGCKVSLRTIEQSDAADLLEIYGCELTMEFASDPVFRSLEAIHRMMESVQSLERSRESLEWAVVEASSGKVIGTCGLHGFGSRGTVCEVGCLLNSKFWRKGYMSEALTLLLSHAGSIGVKRVLADIDARNVRSIGFFESLGFVKREAMYSLEV